MTGLVDLDAYFARIGYAGARAPSYETLSALHLLHPQTIPFENLNPFLGLPVSLDPLVIEEKFVHARRGGYCFEQNAYFAAVLEALGFEVTRLAARVLWGVPEGTVTPRSHMLLLVRIAPCDYVVDVGFGSLTQTAPLLLAGGEQATPHEIFCIEAGGGYFKVQARTGAEWRALHRFDMVPQLPIDYRYANYFVATSPASQFVTELRLSRATPDGRYALGNRVLSRYAKDGSVERRELISVDELMKVLRDEFLIDAPPGLRENWHRLA